MATVPFITVGEVKNYLQITSNNYDAQLSNTVVFACAVIESYLGYPVLANTYTEYYDGGRSSFFTKRIPINSIYSLEEFNGEDYEVASSENVSGTNHTITNSAGFQTKFKKFGAGAMSFTDAAQNIQISPSDDLYFENEDWTIEAWIRPSDTTTGRRLWGHAANTNAYHKLILHPDNGLEFTINDGSGAVTVTGNTNPFVSYQWSHVAVVRDRSNLRMFVNGTQIGLNNSFSEQVPYMSSNNFYINGCWDSSNLSSFSGYLDEFRVSSDARYVVNFTPPTSAFASDTDTAVLLHLDSNTVTDTHAGTADFTYKADTGEISKLTGAGGGTLDLSITGLSTFANYRNGIRLTYNAGYSDAPADLKVAAMDYTKILFKQTQENSTMIMSGEHVNQFPQSANMPVHIRRVLDFHRIV